MNYKQTIFWQLILFSISQLLSLDLKKDNKRKVQNLLAFAKMYGYVRFFHPSDEAQEINWEKFASYGSSKVIQAKNDNELKNILNNLFKPIAPTSHVYQKSETIDKSLKENIPLDLSNFKLTFWQYNGLQINNAIYVSGRTNRFFKVMKKPDKSEVVAKFTFKLSKNCMIQDSVRISMKAIKPFMDSLDTRISYESDMKKYFNPIQDSITDNAWHTYSFTMPKDNIVDNKILIYIDNFEKVLIDEFTLEIKKNEQWQLIEKHNFNSDRIGSLPQNLLFGNVLLYNVDYFVKEYENKKVLEVSKSNSSLDYTMGYYDKIFDLSLTFPEIIDKPINNNLMLFMPLTLYCNSDYTYPKADTKALKILQDSLSLVDTKSGDDLDNRIASVIIYWNYLQHFYPYWDLAGNKWNDQLTQALEEVFNTKDNRDILFLIKKMGSYTKDAHCYINNYQLINRKSLPFRIDWIEKKWILTAKIDSVCSIPPGSELISIDGHDFNNFMRENRIYHEKSSVHGTLSNLFNNIMSYYQNVEPEFIFKTPQAELIKKKYPLRNDLPFFTLFKNPENLIEYPDSIYYLNINTQALTDQDLESLYPKLIKAKGIILDLRYYPGISLDLLSHLISTENTVKEYFKEYRVYPDHENIFVTEKEIGWPIKPKEPYIHTKTVVLSSTLSQSYCESYISYLQMNKLATVIGSHTTGSTGNIVRTSLPCDIYVIWTGMYIKNYDGTRFHGTGVTPDIEVCQTINGIGEGRDEVLEKALEFMRK